MDFAITLSYRKYVSVCLSPPLLKSPQLKESRREAGAHHESKPRMSKAPKLAPVFNSFWQIVASANQAASPLKRLTLSNTRRTLGSLFLKCDALLRVLLRIIVRETADPGRKLQPLQGQSLRTPPDGCIQLPFPEPRGRCAGPCRRLFVYVSKCDRCEMKRRRVHSTALQREQSRTAVHIAD